MERLVKHSCDPRVYSLRWDNCVKIGYTVNLNRRLREFNSDASLPPFVVGRDCVHLVDVSGGLAEENFLHRELSSYRIWGREWYAPRCVESIAWKSIFATADGVPVICPASVVPAKAFSVALDETIQETLRDVARSRSKEFGKRVTIQDLVDEVFRYWIASKANKSGATAR